ncbi:MAG TPA: Ger(x)C family spore germination C-terminal domain-containing protein, partial [Clostridia bacterium]|nr:Ger(x)C family spore germination C-terminal domain-containing protein [Clostridia bacterium]
MYFSLSVSKSDTKITYERSEDGQFNFMIKIKITTVLTHTDIPANMLKQDVISSYEQCAEAQLKESIEAAVQRVQLEYESDVFLLGHYIYNTNNRLWHEVKDNWNEFFRNARVVAEPEISIINTDYKKL